MIVASAPFRIEQDSIMLEAAANGHPVTMILDTGDAIGPTFNAADAQRLGLVPGEPIGVSGAGGQSQVLATTATIQLGRESFADEPCAIDAELGGPSLLGLPFFLRNALRLELDFAAGLLVLVARA
jgi:predicted aspartyl protease